MTTTYFIGVAKDNTTKYATKTNDGINFSNITYPFSVAVTANSAKIAYLNGTIFAFYSITEFYKSADFGATWTKLPNLTSGGDYFFALNGKLYFYAYNTSSNYRYSTDGQTWTTVSQTTTLPNKAKLITTDSAIYLFGDVNSSLSVYKTSDGSTWTNIGNFDDRLQGDLSYSVPSFEYINGKFFYTCITDANATNQYTKDVFYGTNPINLNTQSKAANIPYTWDNSNPLVFNANNQLHIVESSTSTVWRLSTDFTTWTNVGTNTTIPNKSGVNTLFVADASSLLLTISGKSISSGNSVMTLSNLLTPSASALSISNGNIQLSATVDTFLIQGKVTLNISGVQNAQVVAVHENLISVYHAITDSSGNYTLEVNQTGNYTLFVSYTDGSGNLYTSTAKPHIKVDGVA